MSDRTGLLYEVTQALFESGLSIATAMVATYGERAVDVFYVRDGFGHKIIHPERLAAIEARLNAALAGRPEAFLDWAPPGLIGGASTGHNPRLPFGKPGGEEQQ